MQQCNYVLYVLSSLLPFSLPETDYASGPYQVQFSPEESTASALIRSLPDACAEQQEEFTLNIQLSAELQNMNIHLGPQDAATVELTDPTGEVTRSTHSKLRMYSQIKTCIQFSNCNAYRQELCKLVFNNYVMNSGNYRYVTTVYCMHVSIVFALHVIEILNSQFDYK